MKTSLLNKLTASTAGFILCITLINAQTNTFPSSGAAGIGTTTPNASAKLEIISTSKGLLIPRMTQAQRNAITSPANALLIYQTDNTPGFYYYSGTAWTAVSIKSANTSLSNLKMTAVNLDLNPFANDSLNLGSVSFGWRNLYATGSIYLDGAKFINNTGVQNLFVGERSGDSITSGFKNTATGWHSLINNTSGSANSALGSGALQANKGGNDNTAVGSTALYSEANGFDNTAVGNGSLQNNTASLNTAVGSLTLLNNTTGTANVAVGYNSLNVNNGSYNTGVGTYALQNNTTGNYNSANGNQALYANTTGYANSGNGYEALELNTTGYENTANGYEALVSNTTGNYNTANGSRSLYSNTTGTYNTASGYSSLYLNTSGTNNSSFGEATLYKNKNGNFNSAFGDNTLFANNSGNFNSAFGQIALRDNTSGNNNTAFGRAASAFNVVGYSNVAIGTNALYHSTNAHNLVAVGDSALYNQAATSEGGEFPQPANNTAIGSKALFGNTTGNNNTAVGFNSLLKNVDGIYNSAIGVFALNQNMHGNANIAIGANALSSNTSDDNTAVGSDALSSNTTGNNNTAVGAGALENNNDGAYNVAIGDGSAATEVSGLSNTIIGHGADVSTNNINYSTAIGEGAIVDASLKVRIGGTSVTSIGGQVDWTTFSDGRYKKNIKENVKGLSFINNLHPITYTVDISSLNAYYNKGRKHDSAYEKIKADTQQSTDEVSKIVYNGFIAQDVEAVAKKLNYEFNGVDKPKTKDGLYGLRYADFVVPLVKAVQELSSQNDSLKNENSSLRKDFNDLKNLVLSIQQKQESCSPCNANANQPGTSQSYAIISDAASLEQNIPNPFNNTTSIKYSLPQQYSSAKIIVVDKSGKVLKELNISGSGKGSLNVDATTLANGAYNYSLYVNGKLIATKQMILSR